MNAPSTFLTKRDASTWLAQQVADISRGKWTDKSLASSMAVRFDAYAAEWLTKRRVRGRPLADRTLVEYRKLLTNHIEPTFGRQSVHRITREQVADWYDGLDESKPTMRAHAYALLRSILATAVLDGHLPANPATIRGAGRTRRARPVNPPTAAEVAAIATAMPARYRLAVLLAGLCGLRYGEVAELRRKDLDTEAGVVMVRRAVVRVHGENRVKPPKSEAGTRDVVIPASLMPLVRRHLLEHSSPGDDGLLFATASDPTRHLAETSLLKMFRAATTEALGRDDLRFHDLRHAAGTLATQNGASLIEVMHRLGHSTPAAALRYQHATAQRDRQIAAAIDEHVRILDL